MKKTIIGISSGVVIALVALFIIYGIFFKTKSTSDENDGKTEKPKNEKTETPNLLIKRKHVDFGQNWGPVYQIPSSHNFYYENISNNYCVKNANDEFVCSENLEDVSLSSNGKANRQLRFKSKDGKKGSMDIVYYLMD